MAIVLTEGLRYEAIFPRQMLVLVLIPGCGKERECTVVYDHTGDA